MYASSEYLFSPVSPFLLTKIQIFLVVIKKMP
jgi:hypothetical protein